VDSHSESAQRFPNGKHLEASFLFD
jgi:hypothetical protein